MADVSVEFGAVDVGLDKTLKSIQDEIKRLEGSVKSGNLPLEDLKGKMKEIGQLTSMEKRIQAMGEQSGQSAPKVDALGKDIKAAGDKSEKMGEQSGIGFGKLAAAVGVGQLAAKAFTAALDAAFSAVQGTIQGFRDALDLGGRLSDLSAASGETAGKLLLLERAFDNSGAGAEKVGPALAKLQDKINSANEGSTEAAVAFGRMGISMDEMAGKTPTEQLALVASGITSIEDPTKRAATAIDLFGKSGAELLPLLTNFQGEMTEAGATVGSMAEIMDRRSNVFDAVSDRFKVIQEKVRDFAAGILDRALPAIDAITSALSRIDAAAVGQKLADAFIGGESAMKGFQAAVDAISIGKVGLAFEVFWESLKLQAMQSGNALYKYLTASLQTTADAIVGLFGPSSGIFTLLIDSFAYAGKASGVKFAQGILALLPDVNDGLLKSVNLLATFLPNIAGPAALAFNAANAGLDALRGSMDGMQANLEKQKETLGTSFDNFSANAKKQIGEIPKEFEQNLASANAEFFKTGEQAALVKKLQDEVTTATAATNAERANGVAATEAELKKREEIRDQAEAAAARAKALSLEIVELETALNEAKSLGNEELTKSLEKQLEQKKANEEIAKLTEEYQKTLGVTKTEAGILAENFVNAKNAAASIGDRAVSVSITTKVDDTRWKDLLADIAANADPKSVQIAMQVTGQDNLNAAYATLQDMETVNKNFQAAFTTIGAQSLEELKANLEGIPTEAQRQLAMQITGEEDFDRAVSKLDSFAGTKESKLLLQAQGFENMDAFQNQLDGIVGEKRTNLLLEALGLDTVEEAKLALDRILANDGKKSAVQIAADTTEAQTKIASLGTTPQTINLDASKSIENIKGEFKKNMDLAISTGEGSKILGEIRGFVETIKGLVEKIEPRLPVAALTA